MTEQSLFLEMLVDAASDAGVPRDVADASIRNFVAGFTEAIRPPFRGHGYELTDEQAEAIAGAVDLELGAHIQASLELAANPPSGVAGDMQRAERARADARILELERHLVVLATGQRSTRSRREALAEAGRIASRPRTKSSATDSRALAPGKAEPDPASHLARFERAIEEGT